MEKLYSISFYLDTRRIKENNKYPVKLRVFDLIIKKQKLFATKFEFTQTEFNSIWNTIKTRNEYKSIKLEMNEVLINTEKIADKIKPFSITEFEKKLFRHKSENINVLYHYDITIKKLLANGQIGTADNYKLSKHSILRFIEHSKKTIPKKLIFNDITPEFLANYERYMTETLNRSKTTVSMYLRALRTIFNDAIRNKDIDKDIYPFGKYKYQVPNSRKVKKALNKEQLSFIFNSTPKTEAQQRAKDFWFFTYACNGMNMKDIANLKYKNLDNDKIIFYREKIKNTKKDDLKPVTVFLNEFSSNIIKKYGNTMINKETLIFPIKDVNLSDEKQHKQVKNFTNATNKQFKKFLLSIGINENISTIWARHSFATNAIRNGATYEMIGEALSHSNTKTTMNYFAGFEDDKKKDLANKLMDF
ncbi:MAG: site-specific integrase [Chitinophagales bacterium]|nr:site-specific integrase [Chitinophagales bacterium]